MSKVVNINNKKDEIHKCPTCDLIDHFTNVLENADISEFHDIVEVIVHQSKELGLIEHLIDEIEDKSGYLDYLINGDTDGELN